jgi:hypothetical protein
MTTCPVGVEPHATLENDYTLKEIVAARSKQQDRDLVFARPPSVWGEDSSQHLRQPP